MQYYSHNQKPYIATLEKNKVSIIDRKTGNNQPGKPSKDFFKEFKLISKYMYDLLLRL